MTNSVSVASFLAATTAMSLSRHTVATHNSSYAAVVAGQARHPSLSSDSHVSGNGVDGRQAHSAGGLGSGPQTATRPAIVPSYLAESAYAERFASKIFHPSTIGPLGLSSVKKAPPSHHGMKYEVVENPPAGDEPSNILPSRWNENDRSQSVELLNNGSEVRFIGAFAAQSIYRRMILTDQIGPAKVSESEAAAVRADKPMPPQCGLFYYEVTIVSGGKEG